jgi:hypothetical protein
MYISTQMMYLCICLYIFIDDNKKTEDTDDDKKKDEGDDEVNHIKDALPLIKGNIYVCICMYVYIYIYIYV